MSGSREETRRIAVDSRTRREESARSAAKRCILIIDDDTAFVRDLLDLWKPPFEVSIASTGREAIAALERGAPALVIADIDLPCYLADTDSEEGFYLMETVKSRWPRLPVIAATGHTDAEERALASGADAFLAKPFSIWELAGTVERLLRENRTTDTKGGSRIESDGA